MTCRAVQCATPRWRLIHASGGSSAIPGLLRFGVRWDVWPMRLKYFGSLRTAYDVLVRRYRALNPGLRGGIGGERLDRTLHDTRAKIANQRLHERILRDLLLGLLLALRARGGVERGGGAVSRTHAYNNVDPATEFLGKRAFQLRDVRALRVQRNGHG